MSASGMMFRRLESVEKCRSCHKVDLVWLWVRQAYREWEPICWNCRTVIMVAAAEALLPHLDKAEED